MKVFEITAEKLKTHKNERETHLALQEAYAGWVKPVPLYIYIAYKEVGLKLPKILANRSWGDFHPADNPDAIPPELLNIFGAHFPNVKGKSGGGTTPKTKPVVQPTTTRKTTPKTKPVVQPTTTPKTKQKSKPVVQPTTPKTKTAKPKSTPKTKATKKSDPKGKGVLTKRQKPKKPTQTTSPMRTRSKSAHM